LIKRNIVVIFLMIGMLAVLAGCGNGSVGSRATLAAQTGTPATGAPTATAGMPAATTGMPAITTEVPAVTMEIAAGTSYAVPTITVGTGTYTCDFAQDRAAFAKDSIDITVGDRLYATQINDWYQNFKYYAGKSVEIEGYFLDFNPYTMVGRKGPSCPYCNGGYVSFEILYDEDLSTLKSESDWIKVQGILRQGTDTEVGVFYYIEAINVEIMPQAGLGTITN
jgi:hypothetical protein